MIKKVVLRIYTAEFIQMLAFSIQPSVIGKN